MCNKNKLIKIGIHGIKIAVNKIGSNKIKTNKNNSQQRQTSCFDEKMDFFK
uniref:Uncharacterized protein n=1 Tax=uncultured Desulfobacterium sp. TaxID=201089 RepID=E1Y8M5_9BACT|nr:unknown protein [uncultured Desulfobacterium sp.]